MELHCGIRDTFERIDEQADEWAVPIVVVDQLCVLLKLFQLLLPRRDVDRVELLHFGLSICLHQRNRQPFRCRQQALHIPTAMRDVDPTAMRDVDDEASRAWRIVIVRRRGRSPRPRPHYPLRMRGPLPLLPGASPGAREGIAEALLLLLCLAYTFFQA